MKDFRQHSKALRIALLMTITESMSHDPAVRFAYSQAMNNRMLDVLEDINQRTDEKDPFDQVKMLNVIFGDETPVIKKHLVDAVNFLAEHEGSGDKDVAVQGTIEHREWFLPPVLHAFTLIIGDACKTFSDDGETHEPS